MAANPNIQYKYDASVCYNQEDPEDKRFVEELIEELEGRRGLRLYVPGRDAVLTDELEGTREIQMVVPGLEVLSDADQIQKRCRRMIIVLSRSFQQSPSDDFQERYAQGVGRERLIPIIREEGVVVPRIHPDMNIYNLTNTDNEKTWVRLTSALRAQLDPSTYFERIIQQELLCITEKREFRLSQNVQRSRPSLRKSSNQLTSETTQISSTDLQLLQKTRKISPDLPLALKETRKTIKLVTVTHIETPEPKEEETTPKHVVPKEDYPYPNTASQQEHLNQPTLTLLQNPTPSQSDDPNSSHEIAQAVEDRTALITLNQPLSSESFSNNQKTEISYLANAIHQEPEDIAGETGSFKEDKSSDL